MAIDLVRERKFRMDEMGREDKGLSSDNFSGEV